MKETEVMQEVATLFEDVNTTNLTKKLRIGAEPLATGDKLKFKTPTKQELQAILSEQKIEGSESVWFAFPDMNGRRVSLGRLLRVGNGLPLIGVTPEERLKSFIALTIAYGGILTLTVKEYKNTGRKFKDEKGNETEQMKLEFEPVSWPQFEAESVAAAA